MNYVTLCNIKKEELKWDSYIPTGATKLIIGTFPTEPRKRKFMFFYPNENNPFWEVLSSIADVDLVSADDKEAVSNRKSILKKLKLGITDMGYKILRQQSSSSDQNIFPVEFMDIFKILDENPTISKLILTSSSGENSVEGWLRGYCSLNSVKFGKLRGKNPKLGSINYKRKLEIVAVHSTSRAAAKKLTDLIDMYKTEIL